jgi:hypothetical protein
MRVVAGTAKKVFGAVSRWNFVPAEPEATTDSR